jgi:ribosomal-protein-alanine N-acetyltransferase
MLETACFSESWSGKALLSLLENSAYLVLLERDVRGDARAYLIGWQVGEEAELARLGVAPVARGQGIGAALVEYALPIWRTAGVQSVFLEVRESNQIARRLYASRGFAEVGLRAGYYADGENALVLRLKF